MLAITKMAADQCDDSFGDRRVGRDGRVVTWDNLGVECILILVVIHVSMIIFLCLRWVKVHPSFIL